MFFFSPPTTDKPFTASDVLRSLCCNVVVRRGVEKSVATRKSLCSHLPREFVIIPPSRFVAVEFVPRGIRGVLVYEPSRRVYDHRICFRANDAIFRANAFGPRQNPAAEKKLNRLSVRQSTRRVLLRRRCNNVIVLTEKYNRRNPTKRRECDGLVLIYKCAAFSVL